jgi:hypothetical protein
MTSPTYENVSGRVGDLGQPGDTLATSARTTGWVGWGIFASVMMIIGGTLDIFNGFIAVVNDDWVVWSNRSAVYLDISTWGWVHIVVGALVVIAGFGVLTGNLLARLVGVLMAAVSLVGNFLFMPAYPLWAITLIVIDALVIWALTAHGAELREPR